MKNILRISLVFILLLLIIFNLRTNNTLDVPIIDVSEPTFEYGICLDSFIVHKGIIKSGQTLGEIFYLHHIDHPIINKIVLKSKNIFDFRKAAPDNRYTVLCSNDSNEVAQYLIYEESVSSYIVFDITNNIDVYRGEKEISIIRRVAYGTISSSLWLTMEELNLSPRLVNEISTIYAWTIDFFKVQKGDSFRVYYEDKYVDGKYIGIGNILAAEFTHKGNNFYSFYFKKNTNYGDYYDEDGNTLRKAFLMAPVDYKRISSRYSRKRKHPVTGQWKGHFGTDYAAAKGTPIWSTANGTVTKASFTKNNGNYVKIKHNNKYTTQYLHMSKIKSGIRNGTFVKQGEIIGYVGSTGLATGPHVCYRFWKNGKQVDPYRQKLPPGDPISNENREDFIFSKDSLFKILMTDNY
ncbi:MAG: peptidoglycan DD-metalloendopeptidase family protein [Flavobacteriales bacterium]|jgi:murein DD-endopeptidase MepM/ murein hydrolase activator NlpD|nr:peptidoglycan DD-metalloendopeptidase family protein [Flavobacteriales bacterium]|tara:strand:- start:80215 stop:81435 length:1221 start_codon:yes stop_codon:yes gene_type:complete